MEFWVTAAGAAVGVTATTLVKTWFDHFIVGATLKQEQQDDDLFTLTEATFAVRDRAINYWSKDDNDRDTIPIAGAITARITFIAQVSDELFADKPELQKALQTDINSFDDSITHGAFMGKNRKAEVSRSVGIEDHAYRLIYRARCCRRKLRRHVIKR